MKRMLRALCAAGGLGCVHTNAALVNPTAKYATTCPDAVQLYTSPARVPGSYKEVALLNSSGSTIWTSEKGMYNSQRQKAAELGANGIVLSDISEPGAGAKVLGAFLGTGTERKGKALAVYVPADSANTVAVCRGWAPPVAHSTAVFGAAEPTTVPAAPASGAVVPSQPQALPASPRPVSRIVDDTPASPPPASRIVDDTPARLVDDVPAGTAYIADAKTRVYYPLGCGAVAAVPADQLLYYRSEQVLINGGYTRSSQC
jgi:hypothetical protein